MQHSGRFAQSVTCVLLMVLVFALAACSEADKTTTEAEKWTVSVAAGNSPLLSGTPAAAAGYRDGPALTAEFDRPAGLAVGPDGSVYIADSGNHRIRRLTPNGEVETVAGSGKAGTENGPAESATFRTPVDITVEVDGALIVVDAEAGQVRRIANGTVTTIAGIDVAACVGQKSGTEPGCPNPGEAPYRDGPAATALFNQPSSAVVTPEGDILVADSSNQVIRRIAHDGAVSTFAGIRGTPGYTDGPAAQARFFFPSKLLLLTDRTLYLTEGSRIRRIDTKENVIPVAGSRAEGMDAAGYADGNRETARMDSPVGLALMPDGSLAVADTGNQRIRKVGLDGTVMTIAGVGGQGMAIGAGTAAKFSHPVAVAAMPDGSLLVSDYNLNRVFRMKESTR